MHALGSLNCWEHRIVGKFNVEMRLVYSIAGAHGKFNCDYILKFLCASDIKNKHTWLANNHILCLD
jgi:hypothetical protein